MFELCFAPVILAGFVNTIGPAYTHQPQTNSIMIEAQTCNRGLGLVVTAAPNSGLYGFGIQYALRLPLGERFAISLIPQAGISHDTHGYQHLPLHTQFEVGGEIALSYDKVSVSYKYWHLSNAGLKQPNWGLDMGAVLVGYSF